MKHNPDEMLVRCILQALQNTVSRILIYGETTGKTTTDIAVITPYKINEDQEARLSNTVAEFNKKHDGKYSVIDIDCSAFTEKREEIPLYQFIQQTGIELWPKKNSIRTIL